MVGCPPVLRMTRPAAVPAAVPATVLAAALAAGVLSGCSAAGDPPEDAAARLADALEAGTLPAALFTGGSPQREYDAVLEGLDRARPEVLRRVLVEVVLPSTTWALLNWS